MMTNVGNWLQGLGFGNLRTVVAPLIVIFAVTPLIVVVSLLLVAVLLVGCVPKPVPVPAAVWLMGSAMAGFAGLRRKKA